MPGKPASSTMRALAQSQAFGSTRIAGAQCSARNTSALSACVATAFRVASGYHWNITGILPDPPGARVLQRDSWSQPVESRLSFVTPAVGNMKETGGGVVLLLLFVMVPAGLRPVRSLSRLATTAARIGRGTVSAGSLSTQSSAYGLYPDPFATADASWDVVFSHRGIAGVADRLELRSRLLNDFGYGRPIRAASTSGSRKPLLARSGTRRLLPASTPSLPTRRITVRVTPRSRRT